ncbi:hypothetical protein BS50DRAFT_582821 [Corynespora cassiicola Philippines]|uniref:Uncharacterized protein n=1 Tax=Corynespora cassiicola Philippines TaxID=1448308 RepID=A0A2T2P6G2_CORCC|nr:hypothetical protein BS50DRAFT_582821 [Corynespora cassiicola Philippines]
MVEAEVEVGDALLAVLAALAALDVDREGIRGRRGGRGGQVRNLQPGLRVIRRGLLWAAAGLLGCWAICSCNARVTDFSKVPLQRFRPVCYPGTAAQPTTGVAGWRIKLIELTC